MKFKTIRDQIFYAVDAALPRQLARIPYQLALDNLSATLSPHGIDVWARNSFKRGNYVFGVSDLDVTIYVYPECTLTTDEILLVLQEHKKIFPFLGESNFYFHSELMPFTDFVNWYELARDPILSFRLPDHQHPVAIEQAVFLLRMLFSDHEKLFHAPELRQKKWSEHFKLLGLDERSYYDFGTVVGVISELLECDISDAVKILEKRDVSDEDIFSGNLPLEWRYLFPNKHLWFHGEENTEAVPAVLKQVCLRQIGWEIWGIMTQLPYLLDHSENLNQHMGRLGQTARLLRPESELPGSIEKLMEFCRKLAAIRNKK